MLVHICCSVDSHYFLQRLRNDFPNEQIIGFFYNPNIHPYSEYSLRLFDVKRSCEKLNIKLIEGDYNLNDWLEAVKGFEDAPEKGKRCSICFDSRLDESSKKALEIGERAITTTLLTSPKKSLDKLKEVGEDIANRYGLEFVTLDYRSNGGTQKQFELAKSDRLYRQNYCGCIFALKSQRESQSLLATELISPINNSILPNSIESKLELFQNIKLLEESKVDFFISKSRFLNYRLFSARVKMGNYVVPSHFLFYSTNRKKYVKTKIDFLNKNIHYMKQDEIKIIDLTLYNRITNSDFKSVKELYFAPISIEKEVYLREQIVDYYDLCSIIVLDRVLDTKYEIEIDSIIFEDIRDKINK